MDVTSYLYKLSLILQEVDVCREILCLRNCPSDGIQNSKLKEVDRIYVFLASLNSKFDQVRGRVLGQRPFPSLMEVCSEVCLEEDRTSAMNILTTLAIDSVAFSVTSSTHDSEKHNGKPVPIYEHYKK